MKRVPKTMRYFIIKTMNAFTKNKQSFGSHTKKKIIERYSNFSILVSVFQNYLFLETL